MSDWSVKIEKFIDWWWLQKSAFNLCWDVNQQNIKMYERKTNKAYTKGEKTCAMTEIGMKQNCC